VSRRGSAAAVLRGGGGALVLAAVLGGCGGGASTVAPPAVLQVTVRVPGQPADVATAFAAGAGRVVTVAHALTGRRLVLLGSPGGRAHRVRVLRSDERLDLALLSVPGLKASAVQTATPRAGQGASVLVVRSERVRSLRATVRRLITARVRDAPDATARVRPALELDAAVMAGDSGAPVLDRDGRVIGMVFAQASDRDDRAYALDARALPSVAG
jgi:S1-C subfamily serine protease